MIEGLPFTLYDLVALGVILVTGLFSALWGVTGLVAGVGAWIGASMLTATLYPYSREWVRPHLSPELLADIVAGAASFGISLAVLIFLGGAIARRIRASALGPIDRALGFALGLGFGYGLAALVTVSAILIAGIDGLPRSWKDSRSFDLLSDSGVALLSLVPQDLKTQGIRNLETAAERAREAEAAINLYQKWVAPQPTPLPDPLPPAYSTEDKSGLNDLIQRSE